MFLKLHETDRAAYGGPEWLDVTAPVEALNDLDFDALNAIDREVVLVVGTGLMRLISRFSTWSIDATRVRVWLALRHAGVDINLGDFKPTKLLQLDLKVDDADPPASTPASSDTSTSETTPGSKTSGSGSTRGSRARTSSSPKRSGR